MSNQREHLFRGKLKDSGEWAESVCPLGTMSSGTIRYDFIPESIGQYTGLTDNNGKKIFEGDIVRIIGEDEIGIVEWDNDDIKFVVIVDNICSDFSHFYGHDLVVIGNVHDDPELLEVTARA